jgi:hypothetical protein
MIRTAYNNRFRDRKDTGSQGRNARPARRDAAPRREGGPRRENSTVVHPWMSLPERLAAAQAAMRELAGNAAFTCPLGESLAPAPDANVGEAANDATKPKTSGVHVIIRKRRLPAGMIPSLAGAG